MKVISTVENIKQVGCDVNYNNAVAIAKDIVWENVDRLLKENSGSLELSYTWYQSIFRINGFTEWRAVTAK